MATPRERFEKLARRWFISEPALFSVYCIHNLEENYRITCGIRSGQGRIEYNPDQVNLMSDPEFEQRVKAEMVRLCLRHPYERQPTGCCRKALQMGSDMVISPAYKLPLVNMAQPQDMGLPEGEHFEWYADTVNDKLREKAKSQQSQDGDKEDNQQGNESQKGGDTSDSSEQISQSDDQGLDGGEQSSNKQDGDQQGQSSNGGLSVEVKGGNQSGQEQTSDTEQGKDPTSDNQQGKDLQASGQGQQSGNEHGQQGQPQPGQEQGESGEESPLFSDNGYTGLWREDEEKLEELKEVLQNVQNWGSLPGSMVGVIEKALQGRIDYRKVLRAFQTSVISTNRSLTRMRPNRRFGFEAMGSKHDMSSKLLVAVDVSGSVSDKALGKFFRIISNFFKYGVDEIDVIQFDAAVCPEVMDLKTGSKKIKEKKVEICGRGGTNFQCVVDYLKEHNTYDGLIIFTDGYAPEPRVDFHTKAKFLWVTETEEEYNRGKGWMKKTGRACFIK